MGGRGGGLRRGVRKRGCDGCTEAVWTVACFRFASRLGREGMIESGTHLYRDVRASPSSNNTKSNAADVHAWIQGAEVAVDAIDRVAYELDARVQAGHRRGFALPAAVDAAGRQMWPGTRLGSQQQQAGSRGANRYSNFGHIANIRNPQRRQACNGSAAVAAAERTASISSCGRNKRRRWTAMPRW